VILVVSDSSPLIALDQIGQLKLLHDLYGEVVVPDAVAAEVAPSLSLPAYITTRPLAMRVGLEALHPTLGPGETEAIILAQQDGAHLLLLDDRAARQIARARGLPVAGTLGLLVRAKEKGLLTVVRPCLEGLKKAGFYTTPALIALVLKQAGEAEP
jgi:predicted nucleic acid-binding protein